GQTWRQHCVSPKDRKQRQPPPVPIPRQTVPTPNLGCILCILGLLPAPNQRHRQSGVGILQCYGDFEKPLRAV
ncbi:MAG: hypothetical protein OXH93_02720, partial [Caldilineaceae bacterium]|nr:hypothetical protein [Caldilineaceae bacterium]